MTDWITNPQLDFLDAVQEFKTKLPGWWYSTGECSVSCDASIGPDRTGPDKHLVPWEAGDDATFDEGFHVDLKQPSTLAQALRHVMEKALAAKAERLLIG